MPEWPLGTGPRVLTLAGNDLTIDTRARKTASSLSRRGFRVIAIGIDWTGDLNDQDLHGALLHRVTPPSDPRVSTRALRWSLPELADSLKYRLELQRQRLQASRRTLRAWAALNPESAARLAYSLRKWRTVSIQRRFQLTLFLYRVAIKAMARRTPKTASWRRQLPELHKFEAAIGPRIDHLEPDLIHVHDIFHLGIACRAKARSTHDTKVVYDAQEFIPGLPTDPLRRAAYIDLETEYIHHADAVVTVSPGLAHLLKKSHGIDSEIVMNIPDHETTVVAESARDVVGLGEDETILIYVGGVAPHRGAETLLQALETLPQEVHLVFVANITTGYVADLLTLASRVGIGQRVHIAPYVAPEAVVPYIRSADISVIPLSRSVPNYEIALPNKLFQSVHAGLPVVVSDNPEMAAFVQGRRLGEVFEGGNPHSLAEAIRKVMADPESYRLSSPELDDDLSWPRQAERLIGVYASLGVHNP